MTTVSVAVRPKVASRALTGYAWGVLGFMVVVVLWGAVVRATSSGAGCGDNWPLCNGLYWPLEHPRVATIIEFTHRSMSGVCTFLVLVLIGWTFYGTRKRDGARKAVVASGLLLVTEALLGAVLVLKHFVENNISDARVAMQSIHFTNTMLLLAALALTAWSLGRGRRGVVASPGASGWAWMAVAATILTGATGSLAALADTLFPSPSVWAGLQSDFAASSPLLVRMRWMHPAASLVALVCVAMLSRGVSPQARRWLLGTVLLQFALGGLDVLLLAPTWMQVVHLLGADVYWVTLVCVAADAVGGIGLGASARPLPASGATV